VLSGIGLIMTVGVYGVVAGIVKMDDLGLHLLTRSGALARTIGRGLLLAAPRLMKALTVIGTAAMFMVGGGILTHGLPLHHFIAHAAELAGGLPAVGGALRAVTPLLLDVLVGIVGGSLTRRQPDPAWRQGGFCRPGRARQTGKPSATTPALTLSSARRQS